MSKFELFRQVTELRLDNDCQEEDLAELFSKYETNPESITPEFLMEFVKELQTIGRQAIQNYIKELEKKGFWEKPPPVVVDKTVSFQNEQMTLNNFEEDYKNFPRTEKAEPVQLLLLRCLIKALLSDHKDGAIKAKLPEFSEVISQEQVQAEVGRLKAALKNEGRINSKISDSLQNLANIGSQVVKEGQYIPSAFDYLMAIKQQLVPIDVSDLQRLIKKTKEVEAEIAEKNIFLFIGETGSGKTTTIKALLGYKMGLSEFKGMSWVTIVEPITDKKVLQMHSNPSCKSVTRYIVAAKPKSEMEAGDIYFTDTPGWGDSSGVEVQLANLIGVKRALRGCNSVVPVIVISKQSWGTRGMGIRNLGRTISTIFQNYQSIKQSVVIIMNRFLPDEMTRMSASLQDLIVQTNPSDKADKQLMSFLNHLKSLADRKKLVSYEPLQGGAKKFIAENLIERQTLSPGAVFKNSNPAQDVIKNFCVESSKRIKYSLQGQDFTMVSYFINAMKLLEEMINEDSIGVELKQIKEDIKKNLQNEYEKISQEFNGKVRALSVTTEDIRNYQESIRKFSASTENYKDIIETRNWTALAERDVNEIVKERANWFMNQKELDDYRSESTLKIMKALAQEMSSSKEIVRIQTDLTKWISEQTDQYTNLYCESLRKSEYDKAVLHFEKAVKMQKYISIIKGDQSYEMPREGADINGELLRHVRDHITAGKGYLKQIHLNIEKVVEIDKRLDQIAGSFKLMGCQTKENIEIISREIKQFSETIKSLSDKQLNDLMRILEDAQKHPATPAVVKSFEEGLEQLKNLQKIESVKTKATEQQETVNHSLNSYLHSQQQNLKKVMDIIKNDPQQLKSHIQEIDTALKGIECLGKFGQENVSMSSNKIQEDTIKQLRSFTPKFFQSLNTIPKTFKFNVAGYGQHIQKMYSGKRMEETFQKLEIFKGQFEELKKRNLQNESILADVLNTATRSFRSFFDERQEENGPSSKGHRNINLNLVEMSLKFTDEIGQECPFESLKTKASDQLGHMVKMLGKLRGEFEHTLGTFKDSIIKAGNVGSESLSPVKSTIREKANDVGDRCREIWKVTRSTFQTVKDISKYPFISEISMIDVETMRGQFYQEVDLLLEALTLEWQNVKGKVNNQLRMNGLLEKCKTFRDSDSDIIESRASEFTRLRDLILESVNTGVKKIGANVGRLLERRKFLELKEVLDSLKLNHSDNQLYEDTIQKIQDFSDDFRTQMKEASNDLAETLKEIKEGRPDLKRIDEFYLKLQQLVDFLKCYETVDLKRIKGILEGDLLRLKPTICDELKVFIESDRIDEALKILQLLQSIEKNLHSIGEETPDNNASSYELKINERLKQIKTDLSSADLNKGGYKQLHEFFKNNSNKDGKAREIATLKAKWEEKIENKLVECIEKIQNARLQTEISESIKLAEEFSKFLPSAIGEKKKIQIEEASKKSKEKHGSQLEKIKGIISETKNLKTIELENVKPVLEYFMEERNEGLEAEFRKCFFSLWDRRKVEFLSKSKQPLSACVKAYRTELVKFMAESKPYQQLVSGIWVELKKRFNVFFEEELQKQADRLKALLTKTGILKSEESIKISDELVEMCQELFISSKQAAESESTKFLQDKIDKVYTHLTKEVVMAYENSTNKVNFSLMFEGKKDGNYFAQFEMVQRLGTVVAKLKQQLEVNNIPAKVGPDTMAGFKTKLEELPDSNELIEGFVTKMEQCINMICGFSITKYVDESKAELDEVLKQFQTALVNIRQHLEIYVFTGRPRVNTEENVQKLKRQVEFMFESSTAAIQRLHKEYDDNTLRKLNSDTLILTAYETAFPTEKKYGGQVKREIEKKIQEDAKRVEILTTETQEAVKSSTLRVNDLKAKEGDEINKAVDKLQKQNKAKTDIIVSDSDKQIAVAPTQPQKEQLEKNKQASLDAEASDLKVKVDDARTKIKKEYSKKHEELELSYKKMLEALGTELSRLKQIEVGLVVAKDQCQKSIGRCLKRVKEEGGKKFSNLLAKELEKVGDSYALIVLNENPVFASFKSKKFKETVANSGEKYVTENLKGIEQRDKKDILEKYQKYKMVLDTFTKDYSSAPDPSFIVKLKKIIKTKAAEVAADYERENPTKGHELMAMVFSLWMILKAEVSNEEGVEYLYEPHPAQIIGMFLILGICGDRKEQLGNRIAQVLTGEGKSVVLGGLSCYLGLVNYDVFCMCYSRLLSRRDYQDFRGMFQELEIEQYVMYGTFAEVTEELFNSKDRELRTDIKEIMQNDKDCSDGIMKKIKGAFKEGPRKRTLLIDEVDVLFAKDFFGQYYTPSTSIKHSCIENLATYAWQQRNDITYKKLTESAQYKACIKEFPKLEKILEYNAIDIVSSVKNFKHSYIIHEGKIGYVLPEGISFKASYGWKTTFAYFYEAERGTIPVRPQDYVSISILCCEMSYAELPNEFAHIMGVTGTLSILPDCQKHVLKDWYSVPKFYEIPSVYGPSRRTLMGARVVKKEEHFQEICKAVAVQVAKNRPVLVFFTTIDMVNEFYMSDQFKALKGNSITLTERNDADATKTRIIRAARAKNITIMTRAFGRGIDFVVGEKDVKDAGGIHVIQTFISQEESESKQVEGRTARQGGVGSYELLIEEDQLKTIRLQLSDIIGKDPQQTQQIIDDARNTLFNSTYSGQIVEAKKCLDNHKIAKQILKNIKDGKNDKVRQEIEKLNHVEMPIGGSGKVVKTVIGIDATGSMSSALDQVLKNTKICLERTYEILRSRGITGGFEIQMAVYRNYNSDMNKLFQFSPFCTNANDLINFLQPVKVDGGWGNEAIENLYNHVLRFESEVDQLIVIGDAACNTPGEVGSKRLNRGQSYWKSNPRFNSVLNGDDLVNQMAAKKIQLHSFYIGSGPGNYFKNVSKLTGGACQEYKYSQPDAAETLTAFIVQNVLNKIGGEKFGKDLVDAYKQKYSKLRFGS